MLTIVTQSWGSSHSEEKKLFQVLLYIYGIASRRHQKLPAGVVWTPHRPGTRVSRLHTSHLCWLGVRHAFLLKTSAWEATERLAERVWSLNTNPHSSLFTSVLMGSSLFQSIFLLAPDFRNGLYASLHCTKVWHRAYPECDATLWRSARVYSVNRVQALHSSLLLTGL